MMLIASSKRRVMSTWMFIIACGPNAERRLVLGGASLHWKKKPAMPVFGILLQIAHTE